VGFILQALVGLLGHLISVARVDMMGVLDRFLFRTVDPTVSGNRPITANPNLASLNLGLTLAVDAMIGLVILLTSLRSIFERSMRSKYDLKVIVPRVLLAIVLAHGSLLFMQMAIDLNNALDGVALSLGGPLNGDTLPWSPSLAPETIARLITGQDLFQVVLIVALVAAMAILVLAYVIRTASSTSSSSPPTGGRFSPSCPTRAVTPAPGCGSSPAPCSCRRCSSSSCAWR
jgi:hypothetical protein